MSNYHLTGIGRIGRLIIIDIEAPNARLLALENKPAAIARTTS